MSTLRDRVISGLAWQGSGRFVERALRFAANLLLARLLAPEDFGAFAAILFPLAAVDALAHLATGPMIIHSDRGESPAYLRTVLAVGVVRGLLLALVMLALAPVMAAYFERPDLMPLFLLAAVQPFIDGLQSPAIHVLARRLRFGLLSFQRVGAALTGAIASLLLVVSDPTVWGLLYGQLIGVGVGCALSWVIAPMSPLPTLDRDAWLEIRGWALRSAGTPVLIMLVAQAPPLLIGRLDSLDALGVFSMNTRLAEFPVYLTLAVAGAVLIPAYSALKNEPDRLRSAWLNAWTGITLVAAPIAVLVAWTGDALPAIVWGERYASSAPLMPILALNGLLSSLLAVTGPLFWGVGRPSIDRTMQAVRVVAVFALGFLLVGAMGLPGVAWALTAGLLCALLVAVPRALSIVGASPLVLLRASTPAILLAFVTLAPLLVLELALEPVHLTRVLLAGLVGILLAGAASVRLASMRRGSSSTEAVTDA